MTQTTTDNLPAAIDNDETILQQLPTLTLKQRAWIAHLFSDARMNATEAARLAGYDCDNPLSYKVIAAQNLAKLSPFIQALARTHALDPARTLARLSELALADPADAIEVNEETGEWHIDLAKAKQLGKTHTIKKLKNSPKYGVEIEMHDAQAALHDLAMIHKLFPERRPDINAVQVNLQQEAYTPPKTHAERVQRIGEMAMLLGLDECITELQRRKAEQEAIELPAHGNIEE